MAAAAAAEPGASSSGRSEAASRAAVCAEAAEAARPGASFSGCPDAASRVDVGAEAAKDLLVSSVGGVERLGSRSDAGGDGGGGATVETEGVHAPWEGWLAITNDLVHLIDFGMDPTDVFGQPELRCPTGHAARMEKAKGQFLCDVCGASTDEGGVLYCDPCDWAACNGCIRVHMRLMSSSERHDAVKAASR